MLRLFRKIRQKLLTENKFGKYLLYAVGEIIILIFGIVFALQVNNWNLKQQDKTTEIVILKAIKADLETDLINMSNDILDHESQVTSSNIILEHLENKLPYNDSLSPHFLETANYTITSSKKGGFETLKSLGVGLISNVELRNQIIFMYDTHYIFLGVLLETNKDYVLYAEKYIFNSRFEEAVNYGLVLGENLEPVDFGGNMIPVDFERLKNDDEYKYFLKTVKNKNKIYLDTLYDAKSKLSQLILNIQEELNQLEK